MRESQTRGISLGRNKTPTIGDTNAAVVIVVVNPVEVLLVLVLVRLVLVRVREREVEVRVRVTDFDVEDLVTVLDFVAVRVLVAVYSKKEGQIRRQRQGTAFFGQLTLLVVEVHLQVFRFPTGFPV